MDTTTGEIHGDLDLAIYGPDKLGEQRVSEMKAAAEHLYSLLTTDKYWLLAEANDVYSLLGVLSRIETRRTRMQRAISEVNEL